jgi:hypothetical protein
MGSLKPDRLQRPRWLEERVALAQPVSGPGHIENDPEVDRGVILGAG